MSVQISDWHGAYRQGWGKNRLRPASFAHPAKNSYGLSVRIYKHAIEEGWVKPGDYVVDCFSGIGGFALEAMRHGLHFVGVELEQRFCDMGQGCNCTGISKADWVRFQGRWDKARYQDGRHWCPQCLAEAKEIEHDRGQMRMFSRAPSTSYVRNSGKIPCTKAHRYLGNIETWEQDGMPGTAVIVQGDSQRLGEVLERASLCLSSPPYTGDALGHAGRASEIDMEKRLHARIAGGIYGETPGNLGNLPDTGFEAALAVASPVYGECLSNPSKKMESTGAGDPIHPRNYGSEPGQLAQMSEGSFDLALSSPVYHSNTASDDPDKRGGLYRDPKRRGDKTLTATYSEDKAQLAQMPEGDFALTISSPPFIGSIHEGGHGIDAEKLAGNKAGPNSQALVMDGYGREPGQLAALSEGDHAAALEAGAETGRAQACISSPPWENIVNTKDQKYVEEKRLFGDYGSTAGQLGQQQGSTFWAASRQILEEVYKVLAPGGHAIWVLKMFVRSGRLVDFPGQWEALCQSVGFRTVCKHRAWMNKNAGVIQVTLDGEEVNMEKWYKSFFRILCEKKGAPRIDWELILCMVKE